MIKIMACCSPKIFPIQIKQIMLNMNIKSLLHWFENITQSIYFIFSHKIYNLNAAGVRKSFGPSNWVKRPENVEKR